MEKLTDILAMNGFAAYIWPSYALAALVMAALLITSIRSLKKSQKSLSHLNTLPDHEA